MKIFKAKTLLSIFMIWTLLNALVGIAIATSSTCTSPCEEDPNATFILTIKMRKGAAVDASIKTVPCKWLAKEKRAALIEPLCKTDIRHGDAGQAAHEACPITCGVCTPPPFDPPVTDSVLGPLEDLVGIWEGNEGSVLISLPEPGTIPSDELKAETLTIPYRETYEIKSLGKMGTPNVGGSIDQTVGACNYTKTVWRTDQTNNRDNQTVIHKEDGMFFYLENIITNVPDHPPGPVGPADEAPYAVSRSAVVPHGNTAMVFGDVTQPAPGQPTFPDFVTHPFTVPPTDFLVGYGEILAEDNPKSILTDALVKGPPVLNTVHFSMSSENGGGVINTNFITKRSNTRKFRVDLWVEDIGNDMKQLQYAEQVNLIFHKNKGEDIIWPHIMVNTLTKIC